MYAEGEETGVVAGELGLNGGEIIEISGDNLMKLRVPLVAGASNDRLDTLDVGGKKTLAQDALTHHACCAERELCSWLKAPCFALG
jgi:hypothetical protein